MNKIQKLSRFFKNLFMVILVGWPIILAIIWFGNQHGFPANVGLCISNFIGTDLYNMIRVPMTWNIKMMGFAVSFIPMGMGMLISWFFMKLFACYEQGDIFTLQGIGTIKKIALIISANVILHPLYETLLTLAMTMHNPVGYRFINVYIGAVDIRNLIMAGLVFFITYIMQEALKLREEQALTV